MTNIFRSVLKPFLILALGLMVASHTTWAGDKESGGLSEYQQKTLKGFVENNKTISNVDFNLKDLRTTPQGIDKTKAELLDIQDSNGNNLVHKLLSKLDESDKDTSLEILVQIFRLFNICGFDIFTHKNTQNLTPIAANLHKFQCFLSLLAERNPSLNIIGYSTPDGTRIKGNFVSYAQGEMQKGLNPIFAREIDDLIVQGSQDDRFLSSIISSAIRTCGTTISIPLEKLADSTLQELSQDKDGLYYLQHYKIDGKSLYNYFIPPIVNEYGNAHNPNQVTLDILFPLYFESGQLLPTSNEVDIRELSLGLKYLLNGRLSDHELKEFFENYRNSQGQNLADIAFRHTNHYYLLKEMKDAGVDVGQLLLIPDNTGQVAFRSEYITSNNIRALREFAPALLTTPFNAKDNVTPLMVFELTNPKFNADGSETPVIDFFGALFKSEPLDNTLWDKMAQSTYARAIFKQRTGHEKHHQQYFGAFGIYTVLTRSQNPETFFSDLSFWKSLFAAAGKVNPQDKGAPLAIRALRANGRVPFSERPTEQQIKSLIKLDANLLSGQSVFGINFNRSANKEEGVNIIQHLQMLGNMAQDPEAMWKALVAPYHHTLSSDLQIRLEEHQINCVIMALSQVMLNKTKDDHSFVKDPNEINFAEIDNFLATKRPQMAGQINSEERYEKLMAKYYPKDSDEEIFA